MSCNDQSSKDQSSKCCSSHSHQNSEGCGCSCHSCNCCSNKGSHDECCEHTKKLLCIADQAWMEALKEKIKQNILASDHQLDELAKIIGETNRDIWQQKIARGKAEEQYKMRLKEVMGKMNCCNPKK